MPMYGFKCSAGHIVDNYYLIDDLPKGKTRCQHKDEDGKLDCKKMASIWLSHNSISGRVSGGTGGGRKMNSAKNQ